MNYELQDVETRNSPVANKDGLSYDWQIAVSANPIGNTYPDFYAKKLSTFNFLKTDTQDQIQEKMKAAGVEFVKKTYPDTK